MKSELFSGDTVMLYQHSNSENGNLPKYRYQNIVEFEFSKLHQNLTPENIRQNLQVSFL